jgi:hypothetical protein
MTRIREWLKGKKSYLVAAAGVLAAVIGWSDGELDTPAMVAAVVAALEAMALRAALAKVGEGA